jgi:vacuolar-type H+-ATPase subunit E/Vma4
MHEDKTVLIILGTLHFGLDRAPEYIQILGNIIREFNPDVICGELSPEELNSNSSSRIKPEYSAAILPVAIEKRITIAPIEPSYDEPFRKEAKRIREEAEEETQKLADGKMTLDFIEKLISVFLARLINVIKIPGAHEYLQRREYDLLFMESWYNVINDYLPKFLAQWNEWNEYFYDRISEAIEKYSGKRILVTVGLDHKYWLWQKLESRNDIVLHNLLSFREYLKNS